MSTVKAPFKFRYKLFADPIDDGDCPYPKVFYSTQGGAIQDPASEDVQGRVVQLRARYAAQHKYPAYAELLAEAMGGGKARYSVSPMVASEFMRQFRDRMAGATDAELMACLTWMLDQPLRSSFNANMGKADLIQAVERWLAENRGRNASASAASRRLDDAQRSEMSARYSQPEMSREQHASVRQIAMENARAGRHESYDDIAARVVATLPGKARYGDNSLEEIKQRGREIQAHNAARYPSLYAQR